MIIYKETEKLRAELFKNAGYFFVSISGLVIIRVVVYGDELQHYLNYKGTCAIICLLAGFVLIEIALAIMNDLDYKNSKKDLKSTLGD